MWIKCTAAAVRLHVRVQPRASRNRIAGRHGDALKLQVAAPPVDGAANQAVIALVADWLQVARRSVAIVQGQASRDKVVQIATEVPAELAAQIRRAVAALRP
jgi:uncharacterized protein (TIGR00251 family)